MPANLNALIRYKTIDQCLRSHRLGCTIEYLMDACTDALSEYRKQRNSVSERTIRDDIRVMRSDILGFNAPIMVEEKYYYYSDRTYSIFKMQIDHQELLSEVFMILLELKMTASKTLSESLTKMLVRISSVTGQNIPDKLTDFPDALSEISAFEPTNDYFEKRNKTDKTINSFKILPQVGSSDSDSDSAGSPPAKALKISRLPNPVLWADVLSLITIK